MPLADKVMLRKRFLIETALDTLKSERALSIHAIGRSSTPWSMSCPASSLRLQTRKPSISLDSKQIQV